MIEISKIISKIKYKVDISFLINKSRIIKDKKEQKKLDNF